MRLSGAKEHRFSRSDRPLWLAPCKLCEAQRAEHRLWMEAPTSSPLRSRSRLRRRLQPVSCCAVALCDPQSSNGQNSNHHTLSQSIRQHAGWPCPVASERREPREPDLDAATGLLPSRSRSRFAPQASVGPPLLVRECDDLNSEPSGFSLSTSRSARGSNHSYKNRDGAAATEHRFWKSIP